MKNRKKIPVLLKIVIAALLIGAICFAGLVGVVCVNEANLPPTDNYDAIVVLGAQIKKDGTPDVQLQWRLDKAYEMYSASPCGIVVCGGQGKDEPRPEGTAMREYLLEKGIPDQQILVDSTSTSTRSNIRNAIALLEGHNVKKILIVTSDYHVARSLAIARDEGLEACGVGSPIKPRYWLKNHCREALAMVKYWAEKYNILPKGA